MSKFVSRFWCIFDFNRSQCSGKNSTFFVIFAWISENGHFSHNYGLEKKLNQPQSPEFAEIHDWTFKI